MSLLIVLCIQGLQSTPNSNSLLRGIAHCKLRMRVLEISQDQEALIARKLDSSWASNMPFQSKHDEIDRSVRLDPKSDAVVEVMYHFCVEIQQGF